MKILLVFFGLIISVSGCSRVSPGRTHRIMFYNVENLFYPEDDSLTMDDEFTPEGVRHWSWYRYRRKVAAVAKVIIAAGEGNPPEVVGLCEIENGRVLSDLVNHPILMRYGYRFIHRDSPDFRGIDVALLYREGFAVAGHTFHPVPCRGAEEGTREILHVQGILGVRDSVDFLVNHWTSRYGDAVSSASRRMLQAEILGRVIDSLCNIREHPLIIAMGDFNEEASSAVMQSLTEGNPLRIPEHSISNRAVEGSYKYRGRWETIDHFLVRDVPGRYSISGAVFCLEPLLEPDESYTGIRPSRTFAGYQYHGGVSDHLPVLLDITVRGDRSP